MSKRFIVILVLFIAAFIGLLLFNRQDAAAPDSESVTTSSHSQGGEDAKVTLIEYGDFQCPACAGYYPVLKEVKAKYGDQITFQFRHFPIVGIHPNAMAAHRAAEAAGRQNKFWEMHDLLYERQQLWKDSTNAPATFEGYAEELKLNMEQYRQDVADPEIKAVIDADTAEGRKLGVDSTPSFVINGRLLDENPRDLSGFSELIDAELAKEDSE